MASHRILYCHCAYAKIIPESVKREVLARLAASGRAFDAVPDLCELSARRDPSLRRLAEGDQEVRIAACFPRSVKWLFKAAGAPLASDVCIENMRTSDASDVVAGLLGEARATASGGTVAGNSDATSGATSGAAASTEDQETP